MSLGTENRAMRLPPITKRRWFVATWLFLLLVLLTLWLVRPWSLFYLLGLEGPGRDAPLKVIQEWLAGEHAPPTPTGCLSLFPAFDLGLAAALLVAIVILLIVLAAPSRTEQPGPWLTRDVGELRFAGFGLRLRTVMLLIAMAGLVLGWEIVARRKWQQRDEYLALASEIMGLEESLAEVEADRSPFLAKTTTPAARAAERAYHRDRFRRSLSFRYARVAALDEQQKKLVAAANKGVPVTSTLRPPLEQDLQPWDLLSMQRYDQALAGFNELISQYSDYAEAHRCRAYILATCPDPKLRNGKEALTSAKRACELTTWRDMQAVSTLAAAYAEAGDFANAVVWQQKAQDLFAAVFYGGSFEADRMTLYKASKPYREPPFGRRSR
jgi:hypothetical protein